MYWFSGFVHQMSMNSFLFFIFQPKLMFFIKNYDFCIVCFWNSPLILLLSFSVSYKQTKTKCWIESIFTNNNKWLFYIIDLIVDICISLLRIFFRWQYSSKSHETKSNHESNKQSWWSTPELNGNNSHWNCHSSFIFLNQFFF